MDRLLTDTESLDIMLEALAEGALLKLSPLLQLCNCAELVLSRESNVVPVPSPVTVVGDLFGQFHDLLEVFMVGGPPPDTNYLFLGNYVNHGYHSVETLMLLLALKVRFPLRIVLLRGNHECERMARAFGLDDEVRRKFPADYAAVWTAVLRVFNCLPYCALVDGSILCLHGGLSPSLPTLDQLVVLDRFGETPSEGIFADLVWSHPDEAAHGYPISVRGAGYGFGREEVDAFMAANALAILIRSGPPLVASGLATYFGAAVYSVFSAPNFQYRCGNIAAILSVQRGEVAPIHYGPSPGNLATPATPPALSGQGGGSAAYL